MARHRRRHQPAPGKAWRADAGLPRRPFRRVQRRGLAEILQRHIHRPGRRRRVAIGWGGRSRRRAGALDRPAELHVGLRIERDVQVLQQLPFGLGAPPRQGLAEGVACGAGLPDRLVRDVRLVERAALGQIHHRPGLLGREAVAGGEIADDRLGLAWLQRQPVGPHHPLHRLRPALRRGARIGDAGHVALPVARMAAAAFLDRQRIGDGDALLGLPRRLRLAVARRRAALRDHGRRGTQDQGGNPGDRDPLHTKLLPADAASPMCAADQEGNVRQAWRSAYGANDP